MRKKTWSVGALVAGWAGYWATLAAVALTPPVALLMKLSKAPPNTSDAAFSFGNTAITATIHSQGQEVWALHTTPLAVALWIAGPPLAMWALWMWRRGHERDSAAASAPALGGSETGMSPLLNEGNADAFRAPDARARNDERIQR